CKSAGSAFDGSNPSPSTISYRLSLLREQAFLYLQSILSPLAGRLSDNKKGFTLLNVKPNIES
ncbi:hypothetical protein, partial [Vibrio metschnikovii]|uniref:hypothetical protein n=1 Tax=Vibrio metschnikovii TaxID=28172 RepID=UPI002FCB1323